MKEEVKISVRALVEFIIRRGDINRSSNSIGDVDAMQEGSRVHRKIQKAQGSGYQAEVPLRLCLSLFLKDPEGKEEEQEAALILEGRADGILDQGNNVNPRYVIDEIKGVYQDIEAMGGPVEVHQAQALCYAYIWAKQKEQKEIGVRLTYCNLETENVRYFEEERKLYELEEWFENLIREYNKWISWHYYWKKKRNASLSLLEFPFPYREGQRELVRGVYRSILRKKRLFIEAPTGVGKTISTVFPAAKAMGENLTEKLFYLTAKTIARTVAEDAFSLLAAQGAKLKVVTLTAKDKICILDKSDCSPESCERAKGHFDRVNEAVYDLLLSEEKISRDKILEYAEKHRVCPFEMCLDVATWADAVVCDYNYVFDPEAHLKRFFSTSGNDYVFLIDEAHNLVDRARDMYSAVLVKEDFLEAKKRAAPYSKKLEKALSACNHDLLGYKRECESMEVWEEIGGFAFHLMQASEAMDEFLQLFPQMEGRDEFLDFYFSILHFRTIYDSMDDKYQIYTDYEDNGNFCLHLCCMDPSTQLKSYLEKARSAVFFSATLLPIRYYREQLGGREEDYAVYAPSPFSKEKRKILIGTDVSTKYTRRSREEYKKIADYIRIMAEGKQGNYLAFFSSYQMMNEVADEMERSVNTEFYFQHPGMTEPEKEEFLEAFAPELTVTRIGFCVMGGIFGEGIDLTEDRLIGAVVVGTGLPMVGNERELFRNFYEEAKGMGFEYAYLYQGMNKVLQSAGRVIRTIEDRGVILLLDGRFLNRQYNELFPREWFPYETVNRQRLPGILKKFWNSVEQQEKE